MTDRFAPTRPRATIAAAVGSLFIANPASAQLFERMGTMATEAGSAFNLIFPVLGFILGAGLLIVGAWNFYKAFRREGRSEGSMAVAVGAMVAGFILLGLTAWATLGTTTLTGQGVSMRGTGGMSW